MSFRGPSEEMDVERVVQETFSRAFSDEARQRPTCTSGPGERFGHSVTFQLGAAMLHRPTLEDHPQVMHVIGRSLVSGNGRAVSVDHHDPDGAHGAWRYGASSAPILSSIRPNPVVLGRMLRRHRQFRCFSEASLLT